MFSEQEKNKITETLINGGVIAFVTDTVWGLGCLPDNENAVKNLRDYNILNKLKRKLEIYLGV